MDAMPSFAFARTANGEGDPVLSESYLAAVAWVESLPENGSGSEKTWVGEAIRASEAHFHRAEPAR